jgi:hypothetical protein
MLNAHIAHLLAAEFERDAQRRAQRPVPQEPVSRRRLGARLGAAIVALRIQAEPCEPPAA